MHLFFPSMYHHFGAAAPWGFGNDGLLDIRLVVSRDGVRLFAGPQCSDFTYGSYEPRKANLSTARAVKLFARRPVCFLREPLGGLQQRNFSVWRAEKP